MREVDTAEPGESVQAAAERMHARNVGTLVVLSEQQQPIGVITDRDLTVKVLARGRDAADTTVQQVMSPCPRCVHEEAPIEAALTVMRSGPFRRVPVVDDEGKLVGLLSLDDILDLLAEEFGEIGALVRRTGPRVLAQID
jgi:CBS domain-containing protein